MFSAAHNDYGAARIVARLWRDIESTYELAIRHNGAHQVASNR